MPMWVVIAVQDNASHRHLYRRASGAHQVLCRACLEEFSAKWSGLDRHAADGLGEDGNFYLVTGQYQAATARECDAFLAAIGAALVFLIDWNKARKAAQLGRQE